MLRHSHHILLRREISPVDDHAAAGDRKREKRLPHGPDPDHGVCQGLPPRSKHKPISLRGAGQEKYPHRQHQEDEEKQRHHDLIGLFYAVGPQKQRKQGTHHYDDVIRHHRIGLRRKGSEPGGGIGGHQGAGQGIHQRFQYIGNNNGIPDSDAQGARQRQPAQHTAHIPGRFSTGGPGIAVGPQGAGGRPPPHGKFRRKADIAENKDKQQIDQQESPAAIAAQFVGETPYIGHSYRRTDRGQNEAPPAGKAPCAFLMFHFIFSVSIEQAVPCGRLAALCYFSASHRKSQHSPARYSKYPQKYA